MARNFHVQERDELLRRIEARDQMIADLEEKVEQCRASVLKLVPTLEDSERQVSELRLEIERLKARAAPEPVQWSGEDDETLPPEWIAKGGYASHPWRWTVRVWAVLESRGLSLWIEQGSIVKGDWWLPMQADPPPEN